MDKQTLNELDSRIVELGRLATLNPSMAKWVIKACITRLINDMPLELAVLVMAGVVNDKAASKHLIEALAKLPHD